MLSSDSRTDVNAQDQDGWSALHFAAAGGHSDVVEELLAHGARLQPDCQGRLPLHLAALSSKAGAVAALLRSSHAQVDARDASGCTALHRAAAQGHQGVLQILLQHGAVAGLAVQGGTTAAHLAAFKGRPEALGSLLAASADPNARDADGATPLHEAAGGAACLACVHALLAAGADPRMPGKAGNAERDLKGMGDGKGSAEDVGEPAADDATVASGHSAESAADSGGAAVGICSSRPAGQGAALRRFGLPDGGAEDDTDSDDGPEAETGLATYMLWELGCTGIAPARARLDPGCIGSWVGVGALGSSRVALWALPLHCAKPAPEPASVVASAGAPPAGNGGPDGQGRGSAGAGGREGDGVRGGSGEARLRAAAAALARLPDPGLARPLGVCAEAGALVTELPPAGSLLDALHSRAPEGAHHPVRLGWAERVRIAAQAARGLAALHAEGLVHGALRPSTVLLEVLPSGAGGIVARLATAPAAALLCGLSMAVVASAPAAYVAPEVAAGAAPAPPADVYALGLTMLQLLAASEADGLAAHAAATLSEGVQGVGRLVDPCAGTWPAAEAADFARLALRCMQEMLGARPSLAAHILPELERLLISAERESSGKQAKAEG
ncbi:hypothetical protein WJX81_003275 [Elliptochloris bilobata]|uniref:Protein kinase domain-containing protein n=1 Tax=Elliptochloris bilobata TaxID=381761 RepID=A0AAW1QL55_9CHLO